MKWLPRAGDWICTALGTKRLASEKPYDDWEFKRLNAGPVDVLLKANRLLQTYPGMEPTALPEPNLRTGFQPQFPRGGYPAAPNFPLRMPFPEPTPSQLGKSSKQWHEGDRMCSNCNNHNYASCSQCSRPSGARLKKKRSLQRPRW